jgi:hypothetical protein
VYLGIAEGKDVLLFGDYVYGIYTIWYGLLVILVLILVVKNKRKIVQSKADKNIRERLRNFEPGNKDDGGETDFREHKDGADPIEEEFVGGVITL